MKREQKGSLSAVLEISNDKGAPPSAIAPGVMILSAALICKSLGVERTGAVSIRTMQEVIWHYTTGQNALLIIESEVLAVILARSLRASLAGLSRK